MLKNSLFVFICCIDFLFVKPTFSNYDSDWSTINIAMYYKDNFDPNWDGVPNSVNNWQPAIQSAINTLHCIGGGTLYFPCGLYKISSSIELSDDSCISQGLGNLVIKGIGPTSSGKRFDEHGSTIYKTTNDDCIFKLPSGKASHPVIDGLNFLGDLDLASNPRKTIVGISAEDNSTKNARVVIKNCNFKHMSVGIDFCTSHGYNDGMIIENVNVINTKCGIKISGGDFTKISKINIWDADTAFYLYSFRGAFIDNILINNCMGYNFFINYSSGLIMNGIHSENCDSIIYNIANSKNIEINGSFSHAGYKRLLNAMVSENITLKNHTTEPGDTACDQPFNGEYDVASGTSYNVQFQNVKFYQKESCTLIERDIVTSENSEPATLNSNNKDLHLKYPFAWLTNGFETLFKVDYNGNVGIGKSNPEDKLVVENGNIVVGNGYIQVDNVVIQQSNGYATFGSNSLATGVRINTDADGSGSNGITVINGGNVGIGTTNPNGYKLNVAGNLYAGSLYIDDQTNAFSLGLRRSDGAMLYGQSGTLRLGGDASGTDMTILTDGRVGIGTPSPSTLIDINGNTFRLRGNRTITHSTDAGNQGDICWDNTYLYIRGTDKWRRITISNSSW